MTFSAFLPEASPLMFIFRLSSLSVHTLSKARILTGYGPRPARFPALIAVHRFTPIPCPSIPNRLTPMSGGERTRTMIPISSNNTGHECITSLPRHDHRGLGILAPATTPTHHPWPTQDCSARSRSRHCRILRVPATCHTQYQLASEATAGSLDPACRPRSASPTIIIVAIISHCKLLQLCRVHSRALGAVLRRTFRSLVLPVSSSMELSPLNSTRDSRYFHKSASAATLTLRLRASSTASSSRHPTYSNTICSLSSLDN